MTIVGFDVGKYELVGVRVDRNAEVKETFTISNTEAEITLLLDRLAKKHKRLVIGSESTALYHKVLALVCLDRHIPFKLLNPITTKQFTRATVRKKKTDLSDALIIAKLLQQSQGRCLNSMDFTPAKTLLRTASSLTDHIKALGLMRQHIADNYPEQDAAVLVLAQCIKQLTEGVNTLRCDLVNGCDLSKDTLSLLQSIPGIGLVTAQIITAEVGDINRFETSKSLVAFAGLDPRVRQSGALLQKNTHLTKRGSPYLRKAVFIATNVGRQHDPELKTYYEKKRMEGRRYTEAITATSKKMINRIFAVWKRGTPYVKVQSIQST